jgi:hypothetical protein
MVGKVAPAGRSIRRKALRLILAVHLYLGLCLSLLFIVWFGSGIVMVYAGYPTTTQEQRLSRLPVLVCPDCSALPDALRLEGQELGDIRLGMWLDRPVYRFLDSTQAWIAIDAPSGAPVAPMSDRDAAELVRRAFGGRSPRLLALHRRPDQWLLSNEVSAQLPLYEFAVGDQADTRVYVSPRSGEVVLASTASQRRWASLGAVPHWLYFTALRQHVGLWTNLVICLAALGTVGLIAGIVLGLARFQYRTRDIAARRGGPVSRSPFVDRWRRWHHYAGLTFGIVALTWTVSGLLSMNPGHWSPDTSPTLVQREGWQGGKAVAAEYPVSPRYALATMARDFPLRELHFALVGGRPYYRGLGTAGRSRLAPAWDSSATRVAELSDAVIAEAVRNVVSKGVVATAARLEQFDNYYYVQEHARPVLPVYRFVFTDPEETRVYVDPAAGEVVRVVGRRARLDRWLYNGLHDFDFPGFADWHPFWDVVMIVLLVGGLLLSITGTVMGWKWVRRWSESGV